ncbi:hypothetical protein ETD86_04375 [Nonomuraea turkmeniaca]|uniref:Uncharacterized protein n=1 Tax=Nonomuraea turkmeniaca TaxID=103838 RepID=A0A5S4FW62_9ACTN|nr:hypothetical protein [Nonomuraea turkmeniaca]TMR24584.1 hypothetical protein ETD86_04375 [Nonomuraea turkmeniaca]
MDERVRRLLDRYAAAGGGAAVLRLAGGRLGDLIVKGVNGHLSSAVAARVTLNGESIVTAGPADLVMLGALCHRPDAYRQR